MRKELLREREALARRLANCGVPLAINGKDEDPSLLMRQLGAVMENCAFDLKYGEAGFIVNLSITITQNVFAIADIFLELPWPDPWLSLIEDPLEGASLYGNYGFPGNRTLAFDRKTVINHHVNVQRLLHRGKTVEGLLLWRGSEPIPDAFVHGASFPATVIVVDQYDNRYTSELTMWADRGGRQVREKLSKEASPKRARPGLFERPDPIPV
jgi:hypothetical protein